MTRRFVTVRTPDLAPVVVETIMLRVDQAGGWSYRRILVVPEAGESPDEAVRRSCELPREESSTVVHSTSWRYRREGQVILTYAVCPDPKPQLPADALAVLRIAQGSTPATPTPERVEVGNVVAHAVRHLALLLATDMVVRRALLRHPGVVMALEGLSPITMHQMRSDAA
ncbi:hypothetical protein [Nonomuraea rhizosphaerae]|uniref:hypothetical protein n=1 Tax=Nonomuraea rhizosphaerae TaxID=2665663 RepID=UPI001C5DF996|nr:hypothetical protein [Nonomuraea rhizosphaerae]